MRYVAAVLCLALLASPALSRTWHVPTEAPTIQAGIDSAAHGDTVLVADGTYTGPGNRDIDYFGKAITVRSASGNPTQCIIDINGTEQDPHRGFYFHTNEDTLSVLEGFTIRDGYVDGWYGGGVYCQAGPMDLPPSASPRISDCIFKFNTPNGVCADGVLAFPVVRDCVFRDNIGAGLLWAGGPDANLAHEFRNCEFIGNLGSGAACGFAAPGVYPTFVNCIFSDNDSTGLDVFVRRRSE